MELTVRISGIVGRYHHRTSQTVQPLGGQVQKAELSLKRGSAFDKSKCRMVEGKQDEDMDIYPVVCIMPET
jgi:glutamine synthetase